MSGAYRWNLTIYTDGACAGNPGRGGWAYVISMPPHERVRSGFEKQTTNNRMELTAAIMGLESLKKPCRVEIVTDSRYLSDAIGKGWLEKWKKNGWKTAEKKPVLNPDLWQRLDVQLNRHDVRFTWIRGHDGHPFNERCDQLAVEASKMTEPPAPSDQVRT